MTSASPSWLRNATFGYDPAMRLYETGSGTSSFRWLYDGWDLAVEYNGSGALLRRDVRGPGGEHLVTLVPASGGTARYWSHSDERGSYIRGSKGDGTADTAQATTYDEYGRQGGAWSVFGIGGERYMLYTDLIYLRHRVYNPADGRFMQPDPTGYGDGMNMYAYVGGDPVNFADPMGLAEDPNDLGEAVVTGKRLNFCGGGYIQIGGICASGVNVSTISFSGNSFSFSTNGAPDIGPGVDCTAQENVVTCALPKAPEACNTSSGPVFFGGIFSEGYLAGGLGRSAGIYRDVTSGETGLFGSSESGFGWGGSFGLEAGIAPNMDSFRGHYSTIGGGVGLWGFNYAYRQGNFFDGLSLSATLGINAMPSPTGIAPGSFHYGTGHTSAIPFSGTSPNCTPAP